MIEADYLIAGAGAMGMAFADELVTENDAILAIISIGELDQLRRIKNIVRLRHVQSIEPNEIVLHDGTIPTTPDTLHVDCTAKGLERRPAVPVFDGDRITLQNLRRGQPTFSAALIGHIEASYGSDADKNELCLPNS